ncbi:putative ribonuclease Z [Blattamonas nauphoetae]|uniref:ribonuclease Z n=1 Tax=Blattamonas nauphoetae TaxID=2049346 RepID=A0ABQ9YAX4_9EUKA|nr:putative ribonuclease Z [Blattamonas nauphoetae]
MFSETKEICAQKKDHTVKPISITDPAPNATPVPRQTICYFIDPSPRAGSLSVKKAQEAGITDKRLFGSLQRGVDVTLPDGRTVFAKDVTDAAQSISSVLVVDCPHESYFPSFFESFSLQNPDSFLSKRLRHDTGRQNLSMECVIVHFTPTRVFVMEEYQNWMWGLTRSQQDSTNTCTFQHLVLNTLCPSINPLSTNNLLHNTLSLVDPAVYPPLFSEEETDTQSSDCQHPLIAGFEHTNLQTFRDDRTGMYFLEKRTESRDRGQKECQGVDLTIHSNAAILAQPGQKIELKTLSEKELVGMKNQRTQTKLKEFFSDSPSSPDCPLLPPAILSRFEIFQISVGGRQFAVDMTNAMQHALSDPLRSKRISPSMLTWLEHSHRPIPSTHPDMHSALPALESENVAAADELARVLVFGSGGGFPRKDRNVESLLVDFSSRRLLSQLEEGREVEDVVIERPFSFMLDCGENTAGQLGRYYSGILANQDRQKEIQKGDGGIRRETVSHIHARQMRQQKFADAMLKSVTTSFISHFHPDHTNGLWPLLAHRHSLRPTTPFTIIGPWKILLWLKFQCLFWPAPFDFIWTMPLTPRMPIADPHPPKLEEENMDVFVRSLNHRYVFTRQRMEGEDGRNDPTTFINTHALKNRKQKFSVHHPVSLPHPTFLIPPTDSFQGPELFLPTLFDTIFPNHSIVRMCFPHTRHPTRGNAGFVADFCVPLSSSSSSPQTSQNPPSAMFRIAYSGDNVTNDHFNSETIFSTVLIHEATFINGDYDGRDDPHHSTLAQSIVRTGESCQPDLLLLTHFSRRTPKSVSFADVVEGNEEFRREYGDGGPVKIDDGLDVSLSTDFETVVIKRPEQSEGIGLVSLHHSTVTRSFCELLDVQSRLRPPEKSRTRKENT